MYRFFDQFWHKSLGRPYELVREVDIGDGTPVILLHGLGSSANIWQNVIARINKNRFHIIAYDLLGFGKSPKPDWLEYDVDDHVRALAHSINKLRLAEPAIIVGHSMGCLVAVRLARLYPNLVKQLILYEMPLYEGLPEKRMYRLRLKLYRAIYKRIIEFDPIYTPVEAKFIQKMGERITGFTVTEQTWLPFVRSLENTIMHQTADEDIKLIESPVEVIYGFRDMFVIRGEPVSIFGEDIGAKITSFTINATHHISISSSKFLCERIVEANSNNFAKTLAKKTRQA